MLLHRRVSMAYVCFFPLLLFASPCRKPVNMTKATINYRHEKTHMMSAIDRSFTDQSTLQEDERLGLSFMDAHNYGNRGKAGEPRHSPCSHPAPARDPDNP